MTLVPPPVSAGKRAPFFHATLVLDSRAWEPVGHREGRKAAPRMQTDRSFIKTIRVYPCVSVAKDVSRPVPVASATLFGLVTQGGWIVTRIAIAGVGGRMGQALVQAVADHPGAKLGAGSESPGSVLVGLPLSGGEGQVKVVADLAGALDDFDVLIDFTKPEATVVHAALCRDHGKRFVVGTTGLTPEQEAALRSTAETVPVVYAPNMSIGVNLLFRLVELAADVLGDSVDIEIVEAHHRLKVDAPSGTALRLGRIVADTLGRDLETDAIYGRQGRTGVRNRRTIGFSTIRAGDIVGDHTVLFAAEGERVEITHRAGSRMTFASGAVRAAVWLHDQSPGLYDMQDVLGLR